MQDDFLAMRKGKRRDYMNYNQLIYLLETKDTYFSFINEKSKEQVKLNFKNKLLIYTNYHSLLLSVPYLRFFLI